MFRNILIVIVLISTCLVSSGCIALLAGAGGTVLWQGGKVISEESASMQRAASATKAVFKAKNITLTDEVTKNMLENKDPPAKEILKKYLDAKGIYKYVPLFKKQYLINTGYDIDIPKKYPTVFKYLCKFENQLKKRQDQGANWYNLRACDYYDEFDRPKIIYVHTAKNHGFSWDESGYYVNNSHYIITNVNKGLLAFLNSRLFDFYKRIKFVAYGDADTSGRCKLDYNKMVQIPVVDFTNQKELLKIVDGILSIASTKDFTIDSTKQTKVKEYERQINQMVYKLYGLTENEIKTVEEFSPK